MSRAFPALGLAPLLTQISIRPAQAQPAQAQPAAQHEGQLNVALVPNNWANYGQVVQAFSERYGIPVTQIDVQGNARNALKAIQAGPVMPDVIDVNFPFGEQARRAGLLQAYRPIGWNKIPANLKDRAGFWAGSHFGVLAFEVNTERVPNPPQDWADLLKPEFASSFALAGDPRTEPLAINSVFAAALANGGSLRNAEPGLAFFKQLHALGRLQPAIAKPELVVSGATPLTLRWDYNALHNRDQHSDKIKVIVPKHGVLARVFVQGITAKAAHPVAAKLWINYLFSDEGQQLLMQGYARSLWFGDLTRRKVLPVELLDRLLPTTAYARVAYPSITQSSAAQKVIAEGWDRIVGVDVS